MDAAGALHEDFRPAPDGFIAERARTVLGESIDLLDRIADHPHRACSTRSPTAPSG